MLPKCLLSIYIYSYRFVLLSTLVRDALFCNGQQQLMLRDSLLIQELRISDWILNPKWEICTYIYVCIQNSSWRVKGNFRYDKNMLHTITYTHTLGFWEHCRGGGGKRRRWEYEERHYEMSSYGYDMVVIILKTQQLCLATQDLHKKMLIKILTWMTEGFMRPIFEPQTIDHWWILGKRIIFLHAYGHG